MTHLMTEAEINEIILKLKTITNYDNWDHIPTAATALAQWIRVKNDVINKRIHESIIKPNEPETQSEPELDLDGKPF